MSNFTVTPLTTTIAARIDGVDLSKKLDARTAQQIRDALANYAVLTFSGQNIDLAQQRVFTGIFGELKNVLALRLAGNEDAAAVLDNRVWDVAAAAKLPTSFHLSDEFKAWHSDSTYCPEIAWVTTLRAEVVPPVGGGTIWTSMTAAYEALSPAMQAWLETLNGVHAIQAGEREVLQVDLQPQHVRDRWDTELAPRTHPIVVVHPVSGRKALFINPTYTIKIDELSKNESADLLRFLFRHCVDPDFTYRHRWSEGDLVVWDQLQTMHIAPTDYLPHERRVVRMTAGLVKPVGVSKRARPVIVANVA